MKVHIVSYTPLDAPGGVPRFNRYLKRVLEEAGHEVHHWSWWSMTPAFRALVNDAYVLEYDKAELLSRWMIRQPGVSRDDVIIGDGFWCGEFSTFGFRRVISVAHGIWGHITKEDADAGVKPENERLHFAQMFHRKRHLELGLPIVSVSEFIAEQMKLQWGFESTVINNAIDPSEIPEYYWDSNISRNTLYVVHGVNDRGNVNKGWDHIDTIERWSRGRGIRVLSLDELHAITGCLTKMGSLQQADIAVIPSGYEGNSYFAAEVMMCDVPVVAYDVGMFRELSVKGAKVGKILPRSTRSPEATLYGLSELMLTNPPQTRVEYEKYASFSDFSEKWVKAVEDICR